MWKWFKYKKETKLTQIVSEETIREALADENLKDSSKKKVITRYRVKQFSHSFV